LTPIQTVEPHYLRYVYYSPICLALLVSFIQSFPTQLKQKIYISVAGESVW
jgi:hypothetical protein